MPPPLDIRLNRAESRRSAGAAEQASAAIRQRGLWRAKAAMGAVIRGALARAGVDPAQATRLCLADEAAAALASLPDTPELQLADQASSAAEMVQDRASKDELEAKIMAMAENFADAPPPDFANASFAELFAWALAQRRAE